MAMHTITAKNIGALADRDQPEAWRVSEAMRAWITRVETRFVDWQRYRRTVTALDRLGDADLADIGIKRGDIRAVARAAAYPSVT